MSVHEWRCRKHPPLPCGGVCPHCLRDRLLRLCPDCACARPCPCASSSSPSSSSSTSGGAVGRVYSLIERERRIGRSRSVTASGGGGIGDERRKSRVWGWASFRKLAAGRAVEEEEHDVLALARSSSVSATAVEAKGASKAGGWGRFLPGPIKVLRHRKSRAGDCRESVRACLGLLCSSFSNSALPIPPWSSSTVEFLEQLVLFGTQASSSSSSRNVRFP